MMIEVATSVYRPESLPIGSEVEAKPQSEVMPQAPKLSNSEKTGSTNKKETSDR